MTYAELIVQLRVELADVEKTEWKDSQLMSLIIRAYRRIYSMIIERQFQIGMTLHPITILKNVATYPLPDNFSVQRGLYRYDMKTRLEFVDIDTFRRIADHGSGVWMIINREIYIDAPVQENELLMLVYYPHEDEVSTTDVADLAKEITYGRELWDSLLGYSAFLAKNIDEMDIQMDVQIISDIEQKLLIRYGRNLQQTKSLGRLV